MRLNFAKAGFNVHLFDDSDPDNPVRIGSLALTNGFPADTTQVHATNYVGRPATIRVIANPEFPLGTIQSMPRSTPGPLQRNSAIPVLRQNRETIAGCFTAPGGTPRLDPAVLRIVVDPLDQIDESGFEHDNELTL